MIKDIVLFSLTLTLTPNGDITTITEYHTPEEIIRVMDEIAPEHPNTHVYATALRFCIENSKVFEGELQRLLQSI